MALKAYECAKSDQFDQIVALNERCLQMLESDSYENLLLLFEERDRLTKTVIFGKKEANNTDIIGILYDFDKAIVAKIIQKKRACVDSLSVLYRQNNANNQYTEMYQNLLNCKS